MNAPCPRCGLPMAVTAALLDGYIQGRCLSHGPATVRVEPAPPERKPQPRSMTMPEIRDRLMALSLERGIPELAELAEQTRRRRPIREAPPQARPMTRGRAAAIREYAAAHPAESEHSIGIHFGVNQGRVSEALHGKRGER